ncbi:MAG: metallophosphoesterase [Myxococcales bacterium]|nr:metallophosphoesterase [Myxococcales bacterium]
MSEPRAAPSDCETVIVSDMHLSEAHVPDPRRPMWMGYKRREFFVDADFARLCAHFADRAERPLELVLNGDVFDFDNVVRLPPRSTGDVDWLGRLRGLASEEWMSLHKIDVILGDHPEWVAALRDFVARGHRVVFVLGNHDCELAWPSVQERILRALGVDTTRPSQVAASEPPSSGDGNDQRVPPPLEEPVVFCSWFYLAGGDTFVSHGHQYDPLCAQKNAIDPLISLNGRPRVRIPFGDLAGRYLLNGMGYFNPHATQNYIMSGVAYLRFFLRYMVRTQPLLVWTWFWGAIATFVIAMREHWSPAMTDPLLVDDKVRAIARRARVSPAMVRKLAALDVPSVCHNPLSVARELWLDRGLLFIAVLLGAWQVVLVINIAWTISPLWVFLPMALFLPPFFVYAYGVKATVFEKPLLTEQNATLIARITGARRVVLGHVHVPEHRTIGPVEYLNGGFWSPAFGEPECRSRLGTQTFVRIGRDGDAELCEWPPGADVPRRYEAPGKDAALPRPPAEPSAAAPELPAASEATDDPAPPRAAASEVDRAADQPSGSSLTGSS